MAKSLVELLSIAGPIGVLSGLFVCVSALSAVIRCALADHVFCCAHVHRSNAATVTLMFPVASLFVGPETQVSLKATLYVLMMAASSSFSTPIGYQTNLMVVGPGGYHALDFARFGHDRSAHSDRGWTLCGDMGKGERARVPHSR